MKLIIDIPEIEYNTRKIMGYFSDNFKILEAVANGTPIPDNATNDDVLKALFDERGYMGIHDRMMHTKWLFASYQKGGNSEYLGGELYEGEFENR